MRFPALRNILCLGAHEDDIEIGCGGTILRLLSENDSTVVHWVVLSSNKNRSDEAQTSAELFLDRARDKKIILKNFRDSYLPYQGMEIKEYFEELAEQLKPDIVFTHCLEDRHQDHRLVSELTWNTFRDQLILEYEIPKYEGDLNPTNIFMHLNREICEKKVQIILDSFQSQKTKQWFSADTFWALLRLRGLESKSLTKFAEGFHCRKMIL